MQIGSVLTGGSPERRPHGGASTEPPPGGGEASHDLRLILPANAQNVVLIRHVVTGLVESLRLRPGLVHDIRLAVTEACTNVVRHAYPDRHGRLEVQVCGESPDALTVVVSDRGSGLRPRSGSEGAGLGLPLMAELAHALEIRERRDTGSCVRMRFLLADG